MRIAILSDIHANREALEAVSADLEQQSVDRVICLGDNVGYGPDPEQVVLHIRQKGYRSIIGNHEFALKDPRGRRWLNFQAAENNQATERLLSAASRKYCCKLPFFLKSEPGYFVHGFPPDSVFRYLERQPDELIGALFDNRAESIFFVGHTHRLQLVTRQGGGIVRCRLERGRVVLSPESKYIVNCGSVGQPRDGDKHAKYLLWDVECSELVVRFVDYDRERTRQKIRDRGFPEIYGLRL